MDALCDGGGNRQMSVIDLNEKPRLAPFFPGLTKVQSGCLSLSIRDGERPWIVCPRRLLAFKSSSPSPSQEWIRGEVMRVSSMSRGALVDVRSEVKIKLVGSGEELARQEPTEVASESEPGTDSVFDYTFDYVLTGRQRMSLARAASVCRQTPRKTLAMAEANGFTLRKEQDEWWIEDFPGDPILILEIMTSSTSGGNKSTRTQIAMAVEDAMTKGNDHNGPGINYRQVWARMVSQLIVRKLEVALAWGGMTVWLVQDVLIDYISSTTALDVHKFRDDRANEVNIMAVSYSNSFGSSAGPIELKESAFYSGPIAAAPKEKSAAFLDIVRLGTPPPKDALWRILFGKRRIYTLTV